ncbi:MAG: hypothetical protein VKO21_12560 [Candidatus Sericytochromatia bacterium]|nr:hypothetical protein [Candidatus Sericytochromatia bacterium]
MHLTERLKRLQDENQLVELFFAPSNTCYLARIVRVGQDFLEFDAYDDDETVVAHNIVPLQLLMGVTTQSLERSRNRLEALFHADASVDPGSEGPGHPHSGNPA